MFNTYCLAMFHSSGQQPCKFIGTKGRLQAVSFSLGNLWGRTQIKWTFECDCVYACDARTLNVVLRSSLCSSPRIFEQKRDCSWSKQKEVLTNIKNSSTATWLVRTPTWLVPFHCFGTSIQLYTSAGIL